MDVALIQWPSDDRLRTELAQRRHPRLLLVEGDANPPVCSDPLEDWVRLPVSRVDREARLRALEARSDGGGPVEPRLDDLGTLEYRGARTQLSGVQARLIQPMIDRFGAVVDRETLTSSGWPDSDAAANSLDVTVGRLRRQLIPVGLKIRTVRSRGYLLCDDASP
jgi:DNA-binding response OmpR family regulator